MSSVAVLSLFPVMMRPPRSAGFRSRPVAAWRRLSWALKVGVRVLCAANTERGLDQGDEVVGLERRDAIQLPSPMFVNSLVAKWRQ